MKNKILLLALPIIFALTIRIVKSQSTQEFGFYTIRMSDSTLCFIDTSWNIHSIGSTGFSTTFPFQALDFDKGGHLWFINGDTLKLVNTSTGNIQPAKAIIFSSSPGGLSMSFNSKNELYIFHEVANVTQGYLYKVDNFVSNTATAFPNNSGVASILGVEFDDKDSLWALDECCTVKPHMINTKTGIAIPNNYPSYGTIAGPDAADMDFSNGRMYALVFSTGSSIYELNLASGSMTLLHTFSERLCGLAGGYRNTITGSCDTLIFNANITGFNPVTYANQIRVYPNPASDNLVIDCGTNYTGLNGYSIRITNLLGQTVYNSPVTTQVTNIQLNPPTWVNGTYVIQFINPQGTVLDTKRIIIQ